MQNPSPQRPMVSLQRMVRPMIFCLIVLSSMMPVLALPGVMPGKSLWGVPLGVSRAQAVSLVGKHLAGFHAKHPPSHHFPHAMIEDIWRFAFGSQSETIEVISQNQRVVQIREWTSGERGQTDSTFAQLLHGHSLQKAAFGFDSPDGDGYVGYYYDDRKRGICFTRGVQDDFLLTLHPDGLIIHRPGAAVLPIEEGVYGKRESASNARVYTNEAAARQAGKHDQNGD